MLSEPSANKEMQMHPQRSRPGLRASWSLFAALLAVPGAAWAGGNSSSGGGALSQATNAVRASVGGPSQPSGGSSAPSHPTSDGPSYPEYHPEYVGTPCYSCAPIMPGPAPSVGQPPQGERPRIFMELGLQSVKDSDGAAMGGLHVSKNNVGMGLAATRYFERGMALDGTDMIHMDVWAFTGQMRVVHAAGTELWLSGGISGSDSNNFKPLLGPTLGAELQHTLTSSIMLRGSARYYMLEEGIRASELRANLDAAFLTLGYRVFRFDVGPALRGPEFGVALRF